MRRAVSRVLGLAVGTLLVTVPARAWVEKRVVSDSVTLDVERDGTASVSHEMLFAVRGGPLPDVFVEAVDPDAELLPEASATRAESGRAAGLPIPLAASLEGTRIALHVQIDRGLRSGTYQIRFGYRTSLARAGRLVPGGSGMALAWSGPSFGDGIDSARVVFRVPRAPTAPRLPKSATADDSAAVSDDSNGVFLSTFRRAADKDELEVVRPHVARGEIVQWRIVVDPGAVDVPASSSPIAAGASSLSVAPASARSVARPADSRWPLVAAALLAFLYAAVVIAKSRAVDVVCRAQRATPRPLVRLPILLRGVLAATGVLGAATTLILGAPSLVATASLLVALAAATHLPPRVNLPLRGPGDWVRLDVSAVDDERPLTAPLFGRLLDAGHPLGFVLFASGLAGFIAAAILLMHRSPYHGVAMGLAAAVLFPIFCTGRAAELPEDGVALPRELIDWLLGELGRDVNLDLQLIGRLPRGAAAHDELRLRIAPKRPVQGFVAIEAGLDFHQGALGLLALPFVIVRVTEASPSADALPKGLLWTRGRTPDERVAVLRPKVPTRRLTADLVRGLSRRLSVEELPGRRQPASRSAASSAGSSLSTAKAGTTSSPAHAT